MLAKAMFMVCHKEEAELLPPQLLPRCPVYDTISIWFLILFPVLSFVPTYLYFLHTFFGIIYVPMYSTCLPIYLHAYVPIVRFIALYLSLNYLHRSSNVLTYLLTY
jgi:hypothetical protein